MFRHAVRKALDFEATAFESLWPSTEIRRLRQPAMGHALPAAESVRPDQEMAPLRQF
jgi:hypothetical protein